MSPRLKLQEGQDPYDESNYKVFNQNDYAPDKMHVKAQEFIENNYDNPFFLYVPHPMPHVPIAVSKKFLGKSEQGLYGDLMMEIDWSVGKIINALEQNNIIDNRKK